MWKSNTLEEAESVSNSFASHGGILELKFKSGCGSVLFRKGSEKTLMGVSTSTHSNLPKFTIDTKQGVARYVTEYAVEEISKK